MLSDYQQSLIMNINGKWVKETHVKSIETIILEIDSDMLTLTINNHKGTTFPYKLHWFGSLAVLVSNETYAIQKADENNLVFGKVKGSLINVL